MSSSESEAHWYGVAGRVPSDLGFKGKGSAGDRELELLGGGKKRRDPEAALHQGSLPGDREEIGGQQVALVWLQ